MALNEVWYALMNNLMVRSESLNLGWGGPSASLTLHAR